MQNQIEKEIEEEKLKCAKYIIIGNESYIPIYKKDLEKLKKSKFIETSIKTKKPSNEFNLIFEMLFDEILLIILSYLSPGEIILFSLTCKQSEYICSDYLLWKQIAIKFQDYFKWNDLCFDYYPNFELRTIQFKIQEKNQNDPKQKQIQELSKTNEKIKNYFDNSNSTIIKTGTYNYQPNFISIKSERIIYIENLENPKQEIEKKGKMIFKELRKIKQQNIEKEKYEKKYNNPNYDPNFYYYDDYELSGTRKYLFNNLISISNPIILITTLIILNYYIDSKKSISIPKLFLLSEIDSIITIIWVIYSKPKYYSLQEYYNYLSLLFSGFIFMIMISLKTSKTFNFIPYLIVLLPFIILFIYFTYQIIEFPNQYFIHKIFYLSLSFIFGFTVFVLLFTSLKLDKLIQIKYSNLIYLMIIYFIICFLKIRNELRIAEDFSYVSVFVIVFISILSFLLLYGDSIIKKLWIALIPFYLVSILPYFYFLIIIFYLIVSIISSFS